MDIHREVDAGFVHPVTDREHLGRLFRGRSGPFAVEIGANRIGSKMPAARTIGVAIGHDMDAALRPQRARHRIGGIGQALERALHPPLGLGLARVLAGIEPHLRRAFAHLEAVDRLAVNRGAEPDIVHALAGGRIGDKIVVPLHRVGREIGAPEQVARRQIADRQRAAVLVLVEGARRARPVFAVFRDAGIVVRPAARIGAGVEAGELEHDFLARLGGDAEVEPLEELGFIVAADREAGGSAVDRQHFDIAAVEPGIDGKGGHQFPWSFLTLIVTVSPLPPGKSLNKPAASVFALVEVCE